MPPPPAPVSRLRSALWILAAYAAANVAAFAVARLLDPSAHPLRVVAYADLAATLVVFAFSVVCDNSSVYDPYWSVAPLAIVPYLVAQRHDVSPRAWLAGTLVFAWGLRLTFNWARGWPGLHHEDWRYADIRRVTGRAYWPVSLLGIHLFPTVMVFLGCLPLWPALATSGRPLGRLDLMATVVTLGAVVLEATADEQLRRFRASRPGTGAIMDEGLWAYSRHPNYFGEVSFWWGVFLFGLASDPCAWWTGAGTVAITVMFAFVSIPMIDRRSRARRPAYGEHMKRVAALVPWYRRG